MKRKKLLYWGIQFTGWIAYFLFSILLLFTTNDFKLTFNLFLYATLSVVISVLLSHGIRYAIITKNLISRKISSLILVTVLLSILAAFALEFSQHFITEYAIEVDFLVNEKEDNEFNWGLFLYYVSRSIILFLLWCGFYYAFIIAEKSRAQEILNLKWEASKNEIELKNLRAQLNPHFLFNSLNSIRALVGLNPQQAKTSVTQLSNLLRKSINLGKLRVISLKEELELVKIYLDLEQVRFEERLKPEFQIDPDSLACEIPPLMIQTIVENAIKHGISKSIDGGIIRLESKRIGDTLELKVINSGQLLENQKSNGIGVLNSKKRLNILYGSNAQFEIEQVKDEVVVKINITYI